MIKSHSSNSWLILFTAIIFLLSRIIDQFNDAYYDYDVCHTLLKGKCDNTDVPAVCPKMCGEYEASAFVEEVDLENLKSSNDEFTTKLLLAGMS